MSVKFGLWTLNELSKQQKNLTFGCPSHDKERADRWRESNWI